MLMLYIAITNTAFPINANIYLLGVADELFNIQLRLAKLF